MLPNYYPQATITSSAPDAVLNPVIAPTVSGLVHEVPEGVLGPLSEISSTISAQSSPESSWEISSPDAVLLAGATPVGEILVRSTPKATYDFVVSPTSSFEFHFPIVNEFLKLASPQGAIHQLATPTSHLFQVSSPEGQLTISPVPTSTIFQHKLPSATVTSIFYTPVLMLDEGFLWLDDGGRLEIGY
jgi:hypothetical protein